VTDTKVLSAERLTSFWLTCAARKLPPARALASSRRLMIA
jgi:hypothetical protein